MKKTVLMFVAIVFGLGPSLARTNAAETKPIAAVVVASYNNLLDDVNFVGKLIDRPQTGADLEGVLSAITQNKGLAGLDKARPAGMIVQASGQDEPTGYAFLPISDFDAATDLLKTLFTVDSEDGLYKLTPNNGAQVLYLKHQGAWAYFSDKPAALAHCAANPLAVLGNLDKHYIVAARFFLANVPPPLREKFLEGVKQGMQNDAAQKDDESDADYASRKKFIGQMESYATRVFGELDEVAMSWSLDRTAEKTFVDFSVTAKPGTKSAYEMYLAGNSLTKLSGFHLADAAVHAALAGPIPAAKQELAASLIEVVRGKGLSDIDKKEKENKKVVAKEVLNGMADLSQKIVKGGHVDGAASVVLTPNAATALVAGYIADGDLLDKILHTVHKAIVDENPGAAQFVKMDAENGQGVNFHKISVPIGKYADNREAVVQMVGESLDVVIGVGKEHAYLAAGRNALPALKTAIQESAAAGSKPVSPLEVSLAVKPVVNLTAEIGKPTDRPKAAMADTELAKTPGKDHVGLTIRPITNGIQARLEVEQGLVRLFGRLVATGEQ
jgi:hypothetical protein